MGDEYIMSHGAIIINTEEELNNIITVLKINNLSGWVNKDYQLPLIVWNFKKERESEQFIVSHSDLYYYKTYEESIDNVPTWNEIRPIDIIKKIPKTLHQLLE